MIICSECEKQLVLEILQKYPEGTQACVIGSIIGKEKGRLLLETPLD
ncbi:hypothetical protein [Neobacillus dielmonensis]|nr:hypothetical protein [Neobacillus dielmonensis]